MKHNSRLYIRHCQVKCKDMTYRVQELFVKNDNLQKIINENEMREHIRVLMSSEAGEETAKYLFNKYITIPKKDIVEEDDED